VLSIHALPHLCPQSCCYCRVITRSAANSDFGCSLPMALDSDCRYSLLHFGLVNTHWIPLEFVELAKATLSLWFFDCPHNGSRLLFSLVHSVHSGQTVLAFTVSCCTLCIVFNVVSVLSCIQSMMGTHCSVRVVHSP
jgi:hypothetical protein